MSEWPLARIQLTSVRGLPDDSENYVLTISIDHFIADALSGWSLISDVLTAYDSILSEGAACLPPVVGTFQDYVALTTRPTTSESETHWTGQFARRYSMPVDWYQGDPRSEGWVQHSLDIATDALTELREVARKLRLTTHDILLTLLHRQLCRMTGEQDVIVGTAITGRDHPIPDIMRIFGCFATIMPLRPDVSPTSSLIEQIRDVASLIAASRKHSHAASEIARVAHVDTPLAALTGLQFFFSFMDFEALPRPSSKRLEISWDRSVTAFEPPRAGTDVALTGRVLEGSLRLTAVGRLAAVDKAVLSDLLSGLVADVKVFLTTAPVNAAIIGYLPTTDSVERMAGQHGYQLDAEEIRAAIFPTKQPRLLERLSCDLGRSAAVCLPWFADELSGLDEVTLGRVIAAAVKLAANSGATDVSLAGMLPSLTRYGYSLSETVGKNGPRVTTGHSMTVVAVVENVAAARDAVGMDSQALALGFLGLGSIGTAVLELYMKTNPTPSQLILCDVASGFDRIRKLADTLSSEYNFKGGARVCLSDGTAPADIYHADLIVGATSQPNVLQVAKLRPGMVVVDDSFPSCVDETLAVERMRNSCDVLIVGGGLLAVEGLERTLDLPIASSGLLPHFRDAVPSCQLESMLRTRRPDLPSTIGLVTLKQSLAYREAASEFGLRSAPLHLGGFLVDRFLLESVEAVLKRSGLRVAGR